MNRKGWIASAGILSVMAMSLGVSATARADDKLLLGPQLGVYYPTDSLTKSRFGNTWVNLGFGSGAVEPPKDKGELAFDLNVLAGHKSGRDVYIAPVGLVYRIPLDNRLDGNVRFYGGVSANYVLTYLESPGDGVKAGFRTTPGGSVFVGTILAKRAYAEARYYATGKVRGFDLSGLNVALGIRF